MPKRKLEQCIFQLKKKNRRCCNRVPANGDEQPVLCWVHEKHRSSLNKPNENGGSSALLATPPRKRRQLEENWTCRKCEASCLPSWDRCMDCDFPKLEDDQYSCHVCTAVNNIQDEKCAICDTIRRRIDPWNCNLCGFRNKFGARCVQCNSEKPHEAEECAICLECLDTDDEVLKSPCCEKFFCHECIETWLKKDESCPLCRKKMTMGNMLEYSLPTSTYLKRAKCGTIIRKDKEAEHTLVCNDCKPNPKPKLVPKKRKRNSKPKPAPRIFFGNPGFQAPNWQPFNYRRQF